MSPISFQMILIFSLVVCLHISWGCPDEERNYLLDFRRGIIDLSGRLSSWQGYNCCQWKGVSCDYHSGHVISLDLKNRYHYKYYSYEWVDFKKSLSGDIHPSLYNLKHLQHLDLSFNDFNGTAISPRLGKLHSLTFLSLEKAGFGGEIPMEIGNLSALRHLDLSGDRRIPSADWRIMKTSGFGALIRNLRSLEYLAMERVNLTMASQNWGEALSGLSNLREIYLSECGLSGSPIPPLWNLTHISHLHLGGNDFPFPLPTWFQNVSSMISLNLSRCSLNDSLLSNLLHRSNLINLDLSYNSLGGEIPHSIANFSSLSSLDLSWNSLEGEIPQSIANFPKLQTLNLERNRLTGNIPSLGKYQQNGKISSSQGHQNELIRLRLDDNQLSGTLPHSLSKLVRLEILTLSSNNLTGNISFSFFDNLTQLIELSLSNNSFTVSISSSWLPQFSQMVSLGLVSCNIQGDFPAFLSTQYSLVNLALANNHIGGTIPTWLWDFPNLRVVILSNNQLQGSLPSVISTQFIVLELRGNRLQGSVPAFNFSFGVLDVSENNFSGSLPATMVGFIINLSQNNLTGEIPHSLCPDGGYINFLDLSKNKLSGRIPPNLGTCSNLKVLYLAQNDFQGEMPEQLGNLTNLVTLNLHRNNLQGTIPSSIRNCTRLQVFDIGNNKIQGSIPAWIGELTELRILSLASNKFEGSVPTWLTKLQILQILDLSHNGFSGVIPKNVGQLQAMVNQSQSYSSEFATFGITSYFVDLFYESDQVTLWVKGLSTPYVKIFRAFVFMDLSHNKLSGNIPSELGLLTSLISLNVSQNNLSGSIPKSLGGLLQLESLDLSVNKLSGTIPSDLLGLTFLSTLNLSDNMLSGLIPKGKQFSTFEASSFSGNPNLHGLPLDNKTLSGLGGEDGQEGSGSGEDEDEDEDEDEMERWWEVAVGLSYGVGFGAVIGVLCFHRNWRSRFFTILDALVQRLLER